MEWKKVLFLSIACPVIYYACKTIDKENNYEGKLSSMELIPKAFGSQMLEGSDWECFEATRDTGLKNLLKEYQCSPYTVSFTHIAQRTVIACCFGKQKPLENTVPKYLD